MDIKREKRNTKQAREIQNMVMQLIQLWIPTLEDELHGQKSALRSRAMKLMALWIERLEMENEEDRLRNAIYGWERENDELNFAVKQYKWEFTNEHV
tara:strand:+ start:206 stop:496 length:291 start_codon:yes stop_codon:yes gene_type:complete